MMHALKLLVLLFTSLLPISLLLLFAFGPVVNNDDGDAQEPGQHRRVQPKFSFTNPGSLFPPSAIISLTDDNSTFFLARPAAFGPVLPQDGLSSPLWVGRGFGDDVSSTSELGCSDDADWGDRESASRHNAPKEIKEVPVEPTNITGQVALLKRGGCGFLAKVLWAQKRGATAVIVGDDVRGGGLVRMYAKGDTSNVTIPSLFTSHTTAHLLSSLIEPQSAAHSESPGTLKVGTNTGRLTYVNSHRKELWVTLTPTSISSSPFFDTLLVLVVSPLVTLTVVYALLLLRSRIRRRRWRAPKSLVDRLPVRTYETISGSTSLSTSTSSSPTAPLLQSIPSESQPQRPTALLPSPTDAPTEAASDPMSATPREEKRPTGLDEWRRRYGGRQKECVICLEEYVDGVSQVMSLPCGHEFHADCITPWLVTRRRTCPICKGDVVRSLAQSYRDRSPSNASMRSNNESLGAGDTSGRTFEA